MLVRSAQVRKVLTVRPETRSFVAAYLKGGIGNKPATNEVGKGSSFVTLGDAIGNNPVPETAPIGNKPNPESEQIRRARLRSPC